MGLPRNSSLIITQQDRAFTIIIRRSFWLAVRAIFTVSLAVAKQPAAILLALMVAVVGHQFLGSVSIAHEVLAPLIVEPDAEIVAWSSLRT